MATITPTSLIIANDGSVYNISWPLLTTTNTDGAPISAVEYADRSIEITGTFGASGSVTLQGSNDGINWYALTRPAGTALTFTSAGLAAVTEITLWIRPLVTNGDGTTSLTATLVARRANPLRT